MKFIFTFDKNSGKKFTPEKKDIYKHLNQDVFSYFASLLCKTKIDKNYFMSLMKNNPELRISYENTVKLANSLITLHKTEKETFDVTYSNIASDLLLMYFVQNQIDNESYEKLNKAIEEVKSSLTDLEENKKMQKLTEDLKLNEIKLRKYQNKISRDDVIIEYIKI